MSLVGLIFRTLEQWKFWLHAMGDQFTQFWQCAKKITSLCLNQQRNVDQDNWDELSKCVLVECGKSTHMFCEVLCFWSLR